MSQIIFSGTVQPPNSEARNVGNTSGLVAATAKASGTGSWQATFRYSPVSASDVLGTASTLVVTNSAPQAEEVKFTPHAAFVGWWTVDSGAVDLNSLRGVLVG